MIGKICSVLTTVALIGACEQKQETSPGPQQSKQAESQQLFAQEISMPHPLKTMIVN